MNQLQGTKAVNAIRPGALIDNASATGQVIDTLGFNFAQIFAQLGATDIALTALKIQECATSGGTYEDVTGLRVGTDANIAGSTSALPTATDDNGLVIFEIDLTKRQRYLKVLATFGDGSVGGYISSLALLGQATITPFSATDRGALQILRV